MGMVLTCSCVCVADHPLLQSPPFRRLAHHPRNHGNSIFSMSLFRAPSATPLRNNVIALALAAVGTGVVGRCRVVRSSVLLTARCRDRARP